MTSVEPPAGQEWIEVTPLPLSPGDLTSWATRPDCGAVVTFCGTARSHSAGRRGIEALEYDANEALAEEAIRAIVRAARSRWPELDRIAVHHRVGVVSVTDSAVVVAVSAPHRQQAFAGAQYCIDTLKESVPMWKREIWPGGSAWSQDTHDIKPVEHS